MQDERNQNQIVRKDAKDCFVESLNDAFDIGKTHFAFATYDLSRPSGSRQTNTVHIYISVDEFLELCRKISSGELRYMLQAKKRNRDNTYLYQHLGGTSAKNLHKQGRPRADRKSLSRTVQLLPSTKSDFLFVADSGPGEETSKGLIVPRFGNKPENHVSVMMSYDAFSELMLLTKAHYQAWLTAWYLQNPVIKQEKQTRTAQQAERPADRRAAADIAAPAYVTMPLF